MHPALSDPVDVLAIGEVMAVFAPEPTGPIRTARTLSISVAGAEANVAIHLSLLGLRTAYLSRVGDDPFGQIVADRLADAGVRAALPVTPGRPTGIYFKDPGQYGDHATRVHYYRAGSAASTMDESIWTSAPPARLVHLSGITPALSESCARLITRGLDARPVSGATIAFDVNYRPGLWPVERAAPVLADLANRADVVFVGLDEAATLWRTSTSADVRRLIDRPAQLVVKDGPVGATVFTPDGTWFVAAGPVEVVEPVGAGDAFAAGYLYGLLTEAHPADRLRFGHRLAANALRTTADVGHAVTAADLTAIARAIAEVAAAIDPAAVNSAAVNSAAINSAAVNSAATEGQNA